VGIRFTDKANPDSFSGGFEGVTMKFAVLAAVFWVMVSGMPAVAQDSDQAIAEAAAILLDNPKDAMKVIEPEARKGTAAAQFYLGLVYRDGIGRAADARLAKDWLGKAEEQGHGGAAVALADMALKVGEAEEADAYLEKAMAAGEAQGFALKAALLEPRDPGTAAAFFGVALGLGDAESGLRLADIYLKEGSPLADPELARAALSQTAGLGSVKALGRLGMLYRDGTGATEDPVAAFTLLQEAVSLGDPEAAKALGEMMVAEDAGYWRNPALGYAYCLWAIRSLEGESCDAFKGLITEDDAKAGAEMAKGF
jgi:TPR repeat protein